MICPQCKEQAWETVERWRQRTGARTISEQTAKDLHEAQAFLARGGAILELHRLALQAMQPEVEELNNEAHSTPS